MLLESRQHLAPRHHPRHRPVRRAADVHVFDEPDLGADRAAEFEQVDQLVVIDAVDDDGVDLEAGKEQGGGDASEDAIQLVEAGQVAEALRAQGVEADGEPVQSGIAQRAGVGLEQDAVGRQARSRIAERAARRRTRSGTSRRSSGSPPVNGPCPRQGR